MLPPGTRAGSGASMVVRSNDGIRSCYVSSTFNSDLQIIRDKRLLAERIVQEIPDRDYLRTNSMGRTQ